MIPYKSKLEGMKDIDLRNKTFAQLSIEERRQEIAYDMLMNYLTKKIEKQGYRDVCYWPSYAVSQVKRIFDPIEFQKAIIELEHEILCSVCARGALMFSRIKIGNQVCPKVDPTDPCCSQTEFKLGGQDREGNEVIEEFNEAILKAMEGCYESEGFLRYAARTPECISAIAANIIQNGDFLPEDDTDYLVEWEVEFQNPEQTWLVHEEVEDEQESY